tara:strand:- start:49 stop:339 length:291 start_codon:yes stop_codon:yes gene_type:complete
MKIENQKAIIGGLFGFSLGVMSMWFVETDKELNNILRNYEVDKVIKENVNTCEDMIEWLSQDVERYSDSTVFDDYIRNLEIICEENRNLLQTKYDY